MHNETQEDNTVIYRNGSPVCLTGLIADTRSGWSDHNYSYSAQDGQEIHLRLIRTRHAGLWRFYLKRGGFVAASWTVNR